MSSSLDDTVAWLQETDPPYATVERARAFGFDPIEPLLGMVEHSQSIYTHPPGPKSELAAARRLVQLYEVIESLAIVAPRAKDGALLKRLAQSDAGQTSSMGVPAPAPPEPDPWLPSRPKSIADIPTLKAIRDWRSTVADYEHRGLGNRPPGRGAARNKARGVTSPAQVVVVNRSKVSGFNLPFLAYFGDFGKLITLVKLKGMSLKSSEGRIAVLAYILKTVGEPDDRGRFRDNREIRAEGFANAESLARAMLDSDTLAPGGPIARVFFEAGGNDMNLLDTLAIGQSMATLIDSHALKTIEFFTDLRPEFKAPPKPPKQGCASIEWMRELLPDVPAEYKMLWVWKKIEDDRGLYGNIRRKTADGGMESVELKPGITAPIGYFLPEDFLAKPIPPKVGLVEGLTAPLVNIVAPGGRREPPTTGKPGTAAGKPGSAAGKPQNESPGDRPVLFLGRSGDTSGDLLILTEELRILAINEYKRNLQSFCTAVMSAAPFVSLAYMVAAVGGIVLAGELLPAVLGEALAGGSRILTTGKLATDLTWTPGVVQWIEALTAAKRWETIVGAGIGAAGIAMDVHAAGGFQAYVEKLANPLEAAFLLLNLLSVKAAFKSGDLGEMIRESRSLAEEAAPFLREKAAARAAAARADRDAAIAARGTGAQRAGELKAESGAAGKLDAPRPQTAANTDRGIGNRLGSETQPTQTGGSSGAPMSDEAKVQSASDIDTQTAPMQPPTDSDRGLGNKLGAEASQDQQPVSYEEGDVAAMRRKKEAAKKRKQEAEARVVEPMENVVGYDGPIMSDRPSSGGTGQNEPLTGRVTTSASAPASGRNRVIALTTSEVQKTRRVRRPLLPDESLVRSPNERYMILGDEREFAASKQGYQLYEYFDERGKLLYVGIAGGELKSEKMVAKETLNNWVKRLQKDHIFSEWIGRARSVRVRADLTFEEMVAYERERIATGKPEFYDDVRIETGSANIAPGGIPTQEYSALVQSAEKHKPFVFDFEAWAVRK